MEVLLIGVIIVAVLLYNKTIDGKKFISDNEVIFEYLKENDFNFLVAVSIK